MKQNFRLKNEDGSVLVVALIMLVLLTLMGIAVTTTTEIETQIAGNEMVYKKTFYKAEAAAMQCAQVLESTTMGDTTVSATNWINLDYVDEWWDPAKNISQTSLDSNTRYTSVYEGVTDTGESRDMMKAKIYSFAIYGRSERSNSESMIKLGYRKAY